MATVVLDDDSPSSSSPIITQRRPVTIDLTLDSDSPPNSPPAAVSRQSRVSHAERTHPGHAHSSRRPMQGPLRLSNHSIQTNQGITYIDLTLDRSSQYPSAPHGQHPHRSHSHSHHRHHQRVGSHGGNDSRTGGDARRSSHHADPPRTTRSGHQRDDRPSGTIRPSPIVLGPFVVDDGEFLSISMGINLRDHILVDLNPQSLYHSTTSVKDPVSPASFPLATRDGFTRDTTGQDIIVCPSCAKELAYEPGNADSSSGSIPRGRVAKREREHHFWALKECGHVYCHKCFDARRQTLKPPSKLGFRLVASGGSIKLLCAVDDCPAEVGNKTLWVGLFM